MSTASVEKWKNYETQLAPLRDILERHGVQV